MNTAIGRFALDSATTGSGNVALGKSAGTAVTTADNVIAIDAAGQNVSNSCFIGHIFGQTSSGGVAVVVNSDGKLGTTASSLRFKKEIEPMDKASEAILALKPVTFRYKSDPNDTPQFGLVAEDVAEINPALVACDKRGEIYTVRYDAVNAMLLNEFLKEHRTVQELKAIVEKREAIAAEQQKQIEALTAGLQKVSAQLELNKAAPQTAMNNH
jgi:hypothetical protein